MQRGERFLSCASDCQYELFGIEKPTPEATQEKSLPIKSKHEGITNENVKNWIIGLFK
jgi:hypothetical protein